MCSSMKRSILIMVFVNAVLGLLSQTTPVYNVPGPEVANLGIFSTTPVSHFTGIPDISIPLYELKSGKFTLPVSASYHLASVKPNTQPGCLGLGWVLAAGGYITRTVRGCYDEMTDSQGYIHGMYGHTAKLAEIRNEPELFNSYTENLESSSYQTSNFYELSPDEFSFNFCGYSGNFYLNENGGWTVVSDQNIQVEFDPSDGFTTFNELKNRIPGYEHWILRDRNTRYFCRFTLITPDGCRYTFGGINAIEFSIPYYSRTTSDLIATSWRLTGITTPDKRQISFDYSYLMEGNSEDVILMANLQYIPMTRTLSNHSAHASYLSSCQVGRAGFSGHLLFPVILKSIETNDEILGFDYFLDRSYGEGFRHGFPLYWKKENQTREDLFFDDSFDPADQFTIFMGNVETNNAGEITYQNIQDRLSCYLLHRITIQNRHGGDSRSIYFDYTGNTRTKLSLITERKGIPELEYRYFEGGGVMYMNLVVPNNSPDLAEPTYRFAYNKRAMPRSFVLTGCDSWGFYNGREYRIGDSQTNFFPRQPLPIFAQAETLQDITWPTGGHTLFTYEGHQYGKIVDYGGTTCTNSTGSSGGLRVRSVTNTDRYGNVLGKKTYYYSESRPNDPSSSISSGILRANPSHHITYRSSGGAVLEVNSFHSFFPNVTNLNTPDVGYMCVIEEATGPSGETEGYTKYYYTNFVDYDNATHFEDPASGCNVEGTTAVTPYSCHSTERGKLKRMDVYDSGNHLIKRTDYEYSRIADGTLLTPLQEIVRMCNDPSFPLYAKIGWLLNTRTYSYLPTKTTESIYTNQGVQTKVVGKRYNADKLLVADSVITSNGSVKVTHYQYAYENNSSVCQQMALNNYLAYPLCTTVTTEDGTTTETNTYQLVEENIEFVPYVAMTVRSNSLDNKTKTMMEVLSTDSWGNPQEIIENGTHRVLSWCWSGQRLALMVEGITLSQFFSHPITFSSDEGEELGNPLVPDGNNSIVWAYTYFPQAAIYGYAYDKNLRLTSSLTPDGMITYYSYDMLGRLTEEYIYRYENSVRTKKTLKSYQYNYYDNNFNIDN